MAYYASEPGTRPPAVLAAGTLWVTLSLRTDACAPLIGIDRPTALMIF